MICPGCDGSRVVWDGKMPSGRILCKLCNGTGRQREELIRHPANPVDEPINPTTIEAIRKREAVNSHDIVIETAGTRWNVTGSVRQLLAEIDRLRAGLTQINQPVSGPSLREKAEAMRIGFHSKNVSDANGNPTGGVVVGTGFTIAWQDGPLGRDGDRKAPNGAFVEDVLDAVKSRLQFFQDSRFNCDANAQAIHHICLALEHLDNRTKDRETRKVEGTHAV